MKLKYYLRGLGIGIVVTALLMGYSNKNQAAEAAIQEQTQEEAADVLVNRVGEEVTTEAETVSELNTVESTKEEQTISESQTEEETETTETAETETTTENESETETVETSEAEETTTEESSVAESTQQASSETITGYQRAVDITIARGDDSGTVARKLQSAGLVENASEYDAYLMQHGYDKKIRTGSVTIPLGATWQEIAEYISGKR